MTDPTPRPPALPPIEVLDEAECHAIVARHRLCVLSVVDGDEPYAVPLFYGFDGHTLHLGLSEGRKVAALEANPSLCLTVVETGPGDAWASVQVTGVAVWLPHGEAREASLGVLMAHNRRLREMSARSGDDGEAGLTDRPPAADPARAGMSEPTRVAAPPGSASSTPDAPASAPRHGTGRILRVAGPRFSGRARR